MTKTPTATNNCDWLRTELLRGLQKLLCLRLEGTPSADMIQGTLAAWLDAITRRKVYEQDRDAPRIRDAFRTLAATRRRWPAPVDLLEAMPRVTTQASAPRLPAGAEAKAKARAVVDDLAARLGVWS